MIKIVITKTKSYEPLFFQKCLTIIVSWTQSVRGQIILWLSDLSSRGGGHFKEKLKGKTTVTAEGFRLINVSTSRPRYLAHLPFPSHES